MLRFERWSGLLGLWMVAGCVSQSISPAEPPAPAPGAAHADARAAAIADEVLLALGGREAWESTRCLAWNFFGRRSHLWDKHTGDYRLQEPERLVRMNLRTLEGRVWIRGEQVTDPAELERHLREARSIWINDSYWLLMPYKLRDPGVSMRFEGEGALPDGRPADVLVLTFAGVGETPDNKYEVWVSRDRRLVEQWAYFEKATDDAPKLTTAWADWKRYGRILLSGYRTEQRRITDIAVHDEVPPEMDALP